MPDESHEQSGGTAAAARRLNVGDALILVAALGLGISGIRDRIRTFSPRAVAWRQELNAASCALACGSKSKLIEL